MKVCPYCNAEIISGSDACDECGQPLDDLHLTPPGSPLERALLADRIGVLEPQPAITVKPADTVDHVLRVLADRSIGCVLVVDAEGEPVGIFSERDAVIRLGPNIDDLRQRPIADFMTPNVQSLDLHAKVAYAVHMMDLGHYRHVPIVDDRGKLKGIISVRDILRYLADRISPVEASQRS